MQCLANGTSYNLPAPNCGYGNYGSGDHAGAREASDTHNVPWRNRVEGGVRVGSGSNYTGSCCNTGSVQLNCGCGSGGW